MGGLPPVSSTPRGAAIGQTQAGPVPEVVEQHTAGLPLPLAGGAAGALTMLPQPPDL